MAKQSILVIDDEPIWHKLLKKLFEEMGYTVLTADTCADGVRQAEQHKPDCIILDFHLKDGDAVSVCSALKASPACSKIPVIIFSSDPDAEITAYAECRAAHFILKGGGLVTDLPVVIKSVLALTGHRELIIET